MQFKAYRSHVYDVVHPMLLDFFLWQTYLKVFRKPKDLTGFSNLLQISSIKIFLCLHNTFRIIKKK